MRIVTIRLDEDILCKVDEVARANKVPRSDVVNEALRKFLGVT